MAPPVTTAQPWRLATSRAVAPVRPTATGVGLEVVVPLPSWPLPLAPQHETVLSVRRAQANALPADTQLAPVSPDTVTGEVLFVVDPSPSWPETFSPQHAAAPVERAAQACVEPTVTLVAFVMPLINVGVR